LKNIAQIFDPLGLSGPCIIQAKIILQKLWLQKLDWDDPLPSGLHSIWDSFRKQLVELRNLDIPRYVSSKDSVKIELHGFADASQNAYGACVYIRVQDSGGKVSVKLLCSKTRVAPLKQQSMPRLELCAALLLARLVHKITNEAKIEPSNKTYWSDSTIVIGWLQLQSNKLQVFVANRIAEIQRLTKVSDWRHVPTDQNPADFLFAA
jgi:hypothetical protein